MKTSKLYKYSTIALLLINIIVVGFMILKPNQHGPIKLKTPELLNLSESQNEQFTALAKKHAAEMENLRTAEKDITKRIFSKLYSPAISDEGSLQTVANLQIKKIESTYQHFVELKAILNQDQMQGFESFIIKATDMILGGKPHGKKRPKN